MISIATLLTVSYCVLGALLLLLFTIKRAPSGYEDENGFHLGAEPGSGLTPSRVRSTVAYPSQARLEGARPPWPLAGEHESDHQADAA